MEIAEVAKGAGQILIDEAPGAAHALQADLHEDPRRVLDVVPGGLDEAGNLSQLRMHPPRALGKRRVIEERLPGEAGREDIGVVLRVALPRPGLLQLEQPPPEARLEHRPLEPLGVGQPCRVDGGQTTSQPAEVPDLRVDRLPPEILEQVVVQVHAVKRRVGGMRLVEIRQIFVNEMRKGFG